jgi:hypothetical protein
MSLSITRVMLKDTHESLKLLGLKKELQQLLKNSAAWNMNIARVFYSTECDNSLINSVKHIIINKIV